MTHLTFRTTFTRCSTGSNTAMGRFMTQLFGSKKEPWVNHPQQSGEKTEISIEGGDEIDSDNEKTSIVEHHQVPLEALRPEQQQQRAPAQRTMPMPSPRAPEEADAAAWQAADSTHQQRQSARAQYASGANQAHAGYPQQDEPEVSDTLTGSPPPSRPQHPQRAQPGQLIGPQDEVSNVGATPLVDDPKLGWQTNVGNQLQNQPRGGATRVGSEVADYRIKSNTGWILLALFLVLGTAGAIAAIMLY